MLKRIFFSFTFMRYIFLIPLFFSIHSNFAQELSKLSDGPFIFIENNKLIQKTIKDGKVLVEELENNQYDTLFIPEKSYFKNVNKIVALSDIHGQYDVLVQLLKTHNIVDQNLDWNFGNGHLVIVGDIFDRGDRVNDILWLVYKLEIQAKKSFGNVHYLLGNHEFMVLQKDLRYLNDHHIKIANLLNLEYDQLYSYQTILGKWIRSKNTIIKINDIVFTHGGISEGFIQKYGVNLDIINATMRDNIDFERDKMRQTSLHDYYYGRDNLTWYRGYFEKYFENHKSDFSEFDVNKILVFLDASHIVVGHTSQNQVVQLFNNKIFGVDSSIKRGKSGELLLIKKNKFFRGAFNGDLIPLIKENKLEK